MIMSHLVYEGGRVMIMSHLVYEGGRVMIMSHTRVMIMSPLVMPTCNAPGNDHEPPCVSKVGQFGT